MKIEKLVITKVPQEITVTGITLLSKEEYNACRKHIKPVDDWWWLRSPGYDQDRAARVLSDGRVYYGGNYVVSGNGAVRPAVVLQLPESDIRNLQIDDGFEMAGYTWTMIADDMAMCDSGVGCTAFREDWQAQDANVYEASDVKKWLEAWAKEKGIEVSV